MVELTPLEVRVLGTLIEKEHLVPDAYPMSLKGIFDGVTQRTNRTPIMDVMIEDVNTAIQSLLVEGLIIEVKGRHVTRYEHLAQSFLKIPSQAVPLLGVLLLRGPQTAAEIRLATERMHRFPTISSINQFMLDMLKREEPLVARLSLKKGKREHRWAHMLSGPVVSVEDAENHEPSTAELMTIILKLQKEVMNLSRRLGEVENLISNE